MYLSLVLTHNPVCFGAAPDGEDDDETDPAAGEDAADADAPADVAAGSLEAAGSAEAGGHTGGSAGSGVQLGRSDSAADSSAHWSVLLKARWEVLRRDELEAMELHQVREGCYVRMWVAWKCVGE